MQPMMESPGFQRRAMDVEDYLNVLRRNVGWVLGPLLTCLTIAVVVAMFWPDTYVSWASIRVVPPQVPEKLVATNATIQMSERLNAMQLTVLARTTLSNIINTYDLYRKDRASLPMEDLIDRVHKNITIVPLSTGGQGRGANALRIAFAYENRYIAQKVTRDLMTRFIDDDQREGANRSRMTTEFLREQYDAAAAQLESLERKVTEYRTVHMGSLPEQMQANIQRMQALESRNAALNGSISRINQDKLMLDSELRNIRERLATAQQNAKMIAETGVRGPGAVDPDDIAVAEKEREIQQYQRLLEKYLLQYTETYPEVQKIRRLIENAKKAKEALINRKLTIKDAPADSAPPVVSGAAAIAGARAAAERNKEIDNLEAQLSRVQAQFKAKEMETDGYLKEISTNEKVQKDLQSKMEVGPQGAQDLEKLLRDRDAAQQQYESLRGRLTQSQMATDVMNREQGEKLEVLDLPTLPDSPSFPNRPLIIGAGAILGLGVGGALVMLRELRDNAIKTLKDVRAYTQFNVIGSIPLLENDLVVRRRRRVAVLTWSTATLLSAVIISGSVYYYLSTKL